MEYFDRTKHFALIQGRYFDAYYIPASRPVNQTGIITARYTVRLFIFLLSPTADTSSVPSIQHTI